MDVGVDSLLEGSVKCRSDLQTRIRALILYHHFNRSCGDTVYDPYTVAAAALNLSSRYEGNIIDVDTLIILFYCMVNETNEVLSPDDQTFICLKKSLMTVDRIMQRKLEFTFSHRIAHQYMIPFLCFVLERLNKSSSFSKAVTETCLRFTCDIYRHPLSINYQPDHLAIGCISAALNVHGISREDLNMLEPWHEAFAPDLTETNLHKIKAMLFLYYYEANESKLLHNRFLWEPNPYDEDAYLYGDAAPVLTDLTKIKREPV